MRSILNDVRAARDRTSRWARRFATAIPMLGLLLLLTACGSGDDGQAQTPGNGSAQEAAAPDRLVFVLQKQKDPEALREDAKRIGDALTARLGVPVEVVVPGSYSASVQALVSGQADVAYVSSLPFLLARRDGGARLILAERRTDARGRARTEYDSLIVVRKDSDLETIDDLEANAGDVTFCFTSPTSTSGFVFAMLRLVREGVLEPGQDPEAVFKEVQYGGGYTQALRQVVDGRADACAVSFYTLEGPRADVYLPKEERDQLRVLARTPGVPTHIVCVRGGLSTAWAERVKEALLAMSDESPELLSDVYGTADFVEVDEDEHVAATIEGVGAAGVPLEGLQ